MPITVPEEGDEITKAISDAWFTDIRDRLNALKPDDIADRALDTQVPELAITSSTVEIYSSGGSSMGINHTYTAATAPYPGYDQTSGWLVVGAGALSSATAQQLLAITGFSVTRPSPTSDANFAGGILILCNIRVLQLFDGGESYPTTQGLAPIFAAFTLQVNLQTSGWVNIAATEEIINNMGPDNISWALCLNNLVEPLAENVIGVRAMVSVHRGSVAAADAKVILGDCNLTVIALRSGFISS
tara:strand:- start:495 stop:1226 length:732 start_codon:yes stop_codon:yes gene_type:complete